MNSSTSYQRITLVDDPVYPEIVLSNPQKRNVLARETMSELHHVLTAISTTEALGVTIAAQGPVFSAGHNFADMAGSGFADARDLLGLCTNMMTLIQQIPQVVIARVHALATAAGCQLVASCDLAVAGESASFQAPGGRGGLFCHTPMVAVARAVGRKRGLEMALTGDPIDARTAADWGLINRVVPDDELVQAARKLLERATRGSAYSKGLGKQTYYAQVDMPQPEAYEYAATVMAAGVTTADGQEGIASFIEKRRPTWTNR